MIIPNRMKMELSMDSKLLQMQVLNQEWYLGIRGGCWSIEFLNGTNHCFNLQDLIFLIDQTKILQKQLKFS